MPSHRRPMLWASQRRPMMGQPMLWQPMLRQATQQGPRQYSKPNKSAWVTSALENHTHGRKNSMAINATDTSVRHSHFRSRSAFLVVKSCVLAFMDASRHLDPQLFVIIVRFLGEPDQDLPESTIRLVFSQLFSISWCSRLLAEFYKYWYDWECDISFHH